MHYSIELWTFRFWEGSIFILLLALNISYGISIFIKWILHCLTKKIMRDNIRHTLNKIITVVCIVIQIFIVSGVAVLQFDDKSYKSYCIRQERREKYQIELNKKYAESQERYNNRPHKDGPGFWSGLIFGALFL